MSAITHVCEDLVERSKVGIQLANQDVTTPVHETSNRFGAMAMIYTEPFLCWHLSAQSTQTILRLKQCCIVNERHAVPVLEDLRPDLFGIAFAPSCTTLDNPVLIALAPLGVKLFKTRPVTYVPIMLVLLCMCTVLDDLGHSLLLESFALL